VLGALALLELAAQVARFVGAPEMRLGLSVGLGVGDLLALCRLLLALTAAQLVDVRIVSAHRRWSPLIATKIIRYRARVINRRTLCTVAMTASVAIAGCGGSASKSTTTSHVNFKAGFSGTQQAFRKLGTDIAQDITGAGNKTDAELAKEFRGLATRAGQEATQLAALPPPATYKTQMASLVSGFRSLKADLSKISSAASKHNATSAAKATRAMLTDAAKIKTADTALSKALGLPPSSASASGSSSSGSSSSESSSASSTTSSSSG
jgi:hypothetical protein